MDAAIDSHAPARVASVKSLRTGGQGAWVFETHWPEHPVEYDRSRQLQSTHAPRDLLIEINRFETRQHAPPRVHRGDNLQQMDYQGQSMQLWRASDVDVLVCTCESVSFVLFFPHNSPAQLLCVLLSSSVFLLMYAWRITSQSTAPNSLLKGPITYGHRASDTSRLWRVARSLPYACVRLVKQRLQVQLLASIPSSVVRSPTQALGDVADVI